ncbi:hypothetical protein GQ43DRAFT_471677 [Delitschia confertaspora ATCC 74209]|uniref:O-methyltransferase domain-containing protein n=1 Tax=Delitschia confertaspora ATCC 74209 TaxID=1513339 RepID=A0A9P4JM39_9PLEO|nr:hypothetical protein GQ43DRAFT_471677 [Delitschia confertaspora ATCC 74209]
MDSVALLESYTNELATAVKTFSNHFRNTKVASTWLPSTSQLELPADALIEVHQARRRILANLVKVDALISKPTDFLQRITGQSQIVACLHWLGTLQVLACIPLTGSVPAKDLAELAGVPESQLLRIIRMTATSGFLCEPTRDYIAHTPLSAPFVTRPSYLDAALFLEEVQNPAALHMAAATQRLGSNGHETEEMSYNANEIPYNAAFGTERSFQTACEDKPKLAKQWAAFLKFAGDGDDELMEVLTRLDWNSLGDACVVEMGAKSTGSAMVLADLYPSLHIVVQMTESKTSAHYGAKQPRPSSSNRTLVSLPLFNSLSFPSNSSSSSNSIEGPFSTEELRTQELLSRITVQKRQFGDLQLIREAQVYILRLPAPSPSIHSSSLPSLILSELQAHLPILCSSPSATLLLTIRVVPEPGSVDPDVEQVARSRDLALLQVAGDRELEMKEVLELVEGCRDQRGSLVVVNRLKGRSSGNTVALGVKYQAYGTSVEGISYNA